MGSDGMHRGRDARVAARRLLSALAVLVLLGCGGGEPSGEAGGPEVGGSAEEVVIPAEGVDLVGTLRLPDRDPPHPAVAIIHGSGPQSRDGGAPGQLGLTLPRPVEVYRELAEGLRARGYAVLTWDKRSCGPFNDCADNGYPTPPDDLPFAVFGQDAAAAVDLLAARDDIGKLVLAGHSQGGTIAAGLAAERPDLAALVLLATPAVPIHEVLDAQAETLARLVAAAGQEGAAAADALAEVRDLADEVAVIADGALDGPAVGGVPRAFWASWIDASRAAPALLSAAALPVLALGGEYDWNVPADQVRAWEAHLGADDRVVILPSITHALTFLGTDDPSAIGPADVGTEVDAAVVDALASWMDTVVGPASP